MIVIARRLTSCAVVFFATFQCSNGQLLLDGLQLMQEGPAAANAGDPVPDNLALAGTAFATSDLGPEIGTPYHFTENLNDGFYGNAFSWIGGDELLFDFPFAGIDLGADPIQNVQSVAFGRSNVLSGDVCNGVCMDRHMGFYTLEYTQVPNPSADLDIDSTNDPTRGWVEIGTLEYLASDGPETNYNNTWQRHRYNFDPVNATGIRLIVPQTGLGGGTAIDEIEIYDVPGEFVPPPPPPPPPEPITIVPAAGFTIEWDGNDGDHFDEIEPPDGSIVPDNLALADNGANAFASSDLGPELGIDFHVTENINDGFYGNSNSWIGGGDNPFAPDAFAGVTFPDTMMIDRVAWGRDNGNNFADACGGQCTDRSLGTYDLQFSRVADADADTEFTGDANTGWQSIGEVTYALSDETFTEYLRHEYSLGDGIVASAIRLVVPMTGLSGGTAIDELEAYGGPFNSNPCDLNADGICDAQDIDLLTAKILEGSNESAFDLNNDQVVDIKDQETLVRDFFGTWIGDANLDDEFNSSDLVKVFQAGKFEANEPASWSEGDWNADGIFGSGDFVAAFQDGGFEQGPRMVAASVPEPTGLAVWLLVYAVSRLKKRRLL